MTKLAWVLLGIGGSLYACYGAALWAVQDHLLFPVPPTSVADLDRHAAEQGITVHRVQTSDGVSLYAWHAASHGDRLLLYFHGNGGGIGAAGWFAQALPGFDVVSFSYRGYPGSEGAPSEAGMILDAQAIWRFVTDDLGFAPERIVIHGQSLGGGVANHLLVDVRPAAAVFDSTFADLADIAQRSAPLLPVRLLLRHRFDSLSRAPDIPTPILILHGDADTLIPVDHGRRLARAYPDARYVEVAGVGHDHWLLDRAEAMDAWRRFVLDAVP